MTIAQRVKTSKRISLLDTKQTIFIDFGYIMYRKYIFIDGSILEVRYYEDNYITVAK